MTDAADRKVAAYSKGMRQRIRLAQAIAHEPKVLVLDEPLNGLDPMARAESLALFEQFGQQGLHVVISSHILHEVDQVSDQVILLSYGYVVAEGQIRGVREEVKEHPMQILVRCDQPSLLASRVFALDTVVEAKLVPPDGFRMAGVLVRTRDADKFYLNLNRIVLENGIQLQSVAPADDDVLSVYQYLIGNDGGNS
jgi:ABC-2 type transport system ATP-binding protein